jgi:hypothetical protein
VLLFVLIPAAAKDDSRQWIGSTLQNRTIPAALSNPPNGTLEPVTKASNSSIPGKDPSANPLNTPQDNRLNKKISLRNT